MLDIENIRTQFPILGKQIDGRPLVYLDNAATTQKPRAVLDRMVEFCERSCASVHRASHYLGEEATAAYEEARETVRRFLNAPSADEIVFTRGATEAINLAADSFGRAFVADGDEVVISEMEHHSNIVPWQVMCRRRGAKLKVLPMNDDGMLEMDALDRLITERTRLICVTHVSNVLGTVNDVRAVARKARSVGVPVLVDGAQSVQHFPVDVRELGCDFLVFSGHKMYADTGIGGLYAKREWLEEMPPYQTGGGMIESVSFEETRYASLPYKFEAGTGNIVGAVSLSAAIVFLEGLGMPEISARDASLVEYARRSLRRMGGVKVYGDAIECSGAVSFNLEGVHPQDAGSVLDKLGIAVRAGRHCAEPLMRRYGVPGMIRASFGVYNTEGEVDALIDGLRRVRSMMSVGTH